MTTPNFIFETKLESKQEKIQFLKDHAQELVIMDLTAFDKSDFFPHYPNLIAATSLHLNQTKKCEVSVRDYKTDVMAFLESKDLSPVLVASLDGYFHLPRILSTIVNEAFFSLEDQIASAEDIDRAMKYGVNYPDGPFSWSQGREKYIVTLLDNLFAQTQNERYKTSSLLRQKSIN